LQGGDHENEGDDTPSAEEMIDPCEGLAEMVTRLGQVCGRRARRDGHVEADAHAERDGADDDDEWRTCMAAECGSEQGACMGDSTCAAEFEEAQESDEGPPSTDGKSAKFGAMVDCFMDNCMAQMMGFEVTDALCDTVADIASNAPAGLADAIEAADGDLGALGGGGDSENEDGAVSVAAQLVTVAVVAAVALVW